MDSSGNRCRDERHESWIRIGLRVAVVATGANSCLRTPEIVVPGRVEQHSRRFSPQHRFSQSRELLARHEVEPGAEERSSAARRRICRRCAAYPNTILVTGDPDASIANDLTNPGCRMVLVS
jgi:hypothetical protein